MTDIAPHATGLPVPGRSLWWLAGGCVVGIALPPIIGIVTALAAYYPIGSVLPESLLFARTGTFILVLLAAVAAVIVGIAYSILSWSWRPLFLSIIVGGVMLPGIYSSLASHLAMRSLAFHQLAERSAPLVAAVDMFEQDNGRPPQALVELVPRYLEEVPGTGMSAYPQFEYALGPGYCDGGNRWNISILAGDLLNWDAFFYCPRKDYPSDLGGQPVELMGDWAYMHE